MYVFQGTDLLARHLLGSLLDINFLSASANTAPAGLLRKGVPLRKDASQVFVRLRHILVCATSMSEAYLFRNHFSL